MWKVTFKGILARKVRLVLTAIAVLLGVSFVSATFVLTDTLDRSFRGLFHDQVSGIDLVIQQRSPFGGDVGRARFDDDIVDVVRRVSGVSAAYGVIQDYAQFVDKHGDAIQLGGAPTRGISWSQRGARGPLRLVPDGDRPGHAPRGRHQVAMDVSTARENDFHVGDHVRVLLEGPAERFKIVGLFGFGDRVQLGAVTFAAFDLETAQHLFGAPHLLDFVYVLRGPGVSVAELRTRVSAAVGPGFEVKPATTFAADRGDQILSFLDLLTQVLLGFAFIGLVVGAFVIFNTFTILVTQRTRELGLLRAMGATGRQVILSVVAEATVIGTIAAIGGLALGLAFAAGLFALLEKAGRDVPEGLVLTDRTVIASLAVGIVVTVVSSVWPAVRASRVSPIAAINDVPQTHSRPFRWRIIIGALVLVLGACALAVGLDRAHGSADVLNEQVNVLGANLPIIGLVALGALTVFVGTIVLLAAFARPLAGVLGVPLRRMGVTGRLARDNAMRNPRRTAATASALVIGLALVGLVSIFGASVKASVDEAIDQGVRADFVLKAQQFSGFSRGVAERLRALPELGAVAAFRYGNTRVGTAEETVAGVTAGQLAPVVDLGIIDGSIGALARDGVLVHRDAAKRYGVKVGDTLPIQFTRGFQNLRVAGIYTQEDFTGGLPVDFIVSERAYDEGFGADQQDVLVYAKAAGGLPAARSAIDAALGRDFPNIEVFTREGYRSDQERQIDRFLAVIVALLILSVIIAVLGIVNTLALSVHERTRELGLLRAVGTSRRQVRRMVRGESVLIALIGGLVGTAIGLLWGWALTSTLSKQGITRVEVPVGQLVAFVLLSMLAGIGAALVPAWRASRLDVLDAITTE